MSAAGSRLLDAWLAGQTPEPTTEAVALRQRLLHAAMVHPVVRVDGSLPLVGFVVPVQDDCAGLGELLPVLRSQFPERQIMVVDDGSADAASVQAVASAYGAELVRHHTGRGPGAARNAGADRLDADVELVCFLDADVVPEAGSIDLLLAHLGDPGVSAVAPRVRAKNGPRVLDSFEAIGSPLDLGAGPAVVRPGSRVSYVPSAALVVRRSALADVAGFDETLQLGEDVDLIWRLVAAGQIVRYEPAATVRHRNRASLVRLLRQRFGYGSSAGPLASRHGNTVTPLRLPVPVLASWLAALFGGRTGAAGAVIAAGVSAAKLADKLQDRVDQPLREAATLVTQSQVGVVQGLATAATRNYLPLMLVARRSRRLLLLATVIPAVLAWLRARPRHDPATHVALSALDNAAYCAGVWTGAWRERSPAALLPHVYSSTDQHD